MSCPIKTFTVVTSEPHSPTWNGTLTITSTDGAGTFLLQGASGNGTPVNVRCGVNPSSQLPTISFKCNNVHYKQATQAPGNPDLYQGDVDRDNDPIAGTDTWTAEAPNEDGGYNEPQ